MSNLSSSSSSTISTDGTEPSHEHFRGDLSCTRGYELFLLREAKKRNPSILTYGLSWGAPGWINNGTSFFGSEMQEYQAQWVQCIQQELGFIIDYIGIYNERPWGGPDYVKGLRAALDSKGFQHTQIVIPDGGYDPSILTDAASDQAFNSSFGVVGLHYPCSDIHPEVADSGKKYWASEHWWDQPDYGGAAAWGHLLNYNWVMMNITATIAWSPLWSVYSNLEDQAAGLMLANEPWSGHWEVSPPIWTSAQWLQFTKPGWNFLSVPSSGSGYLPLGGTYVSLTPPTGTGLTLILETFGSKAGRCAQKDATGVQNVTFFLQNSPLPGPGATLFVWQTNETDYFIQLDDITVGPDSSFSIQIAPFSMVTITTVSGGKKGTPSFPIPPSSPFPLPYNDDFSQYTYDTLAKYFADQFGSFAVRNGTLVQVSPMNPGKLAWSGDTDPFSLIGDVNWKNVRVSTTVLIPPTSSSLPFDLQMQSNDGLPALLSPCSDSPEQKWLFNAVAPGYISNVDASGSQQCLNAYGCGQKAVYWSCVTTGGTCCGADCYDGLIFTFNQETFQIKSALPSVGCLTAETSTGNTKSLTFSTCAQSGSVPSNQTFTFDTTTGHIELGATGLCLAQPPPPPPPVKYAQVCSRIAGYTAFDKPKPPPGYCLSVLLDGSSQWALTSKSGIIVNGTLPTSLLPGTVVELSVSTVDANITAFVNGTLLSSITSSEHLNGMAALGTSFDFVAFDSFSVVPAS